MCDSVLSADQSPLPACPRLSLPRLPSAKGKSVRPQPLTRVHMPEAYFKAFRGSQCNIFETLGGCGLPMASLTNAANSTTTTTATAISTSTSSGTTTSYKYPHHQPPTLPTTHHPNTTITTVTTTAASTTPTFQLGMLVNLKLSSFTSAIDVEMLELLVVF